MTWPTVKLGDVCITTSGGTPKRGVGEYYGGGIAWVKSGELHCDLVTITEETLTNEGLSNSSAKLMPKGTVLLAMYGATIGAVSVLDIEAATNQAICCIRANPKKLYSKFLVHFLKASKEKLINYAVGGAQPNINQDIIRNLQIKLPSLAEQQRIAAILEKAEEIKRKREQAIAKLDELAQSTFVEMFGDPVTNSKNWPIKRLSTLIKEGDSINYGVVQPGDDYDDGVPLIRAGDVVSGKICKDNLKKIDPKIEANYKRSRLLGSEILVSCVGSIGSVILANPSMKGFNIARAVARISPSNIINRIYLAEYLKCLRVQRYFTAELRTVSQPTLNIKQICETEILYPPIDFQIKFEKIMNVIDKERRAFSTSSHEFLSLISSLQNQAFTTGFNA